MSAKELTNLPLEEFEKHLFESVQEALETFGDYSKSIIDKTLEISGREIKYYDLRKILVNASWSWHHARGDDALKNVIKRVIRSIYYDLVFNNKEERSALYFRAFQDNNFGSNKLGVIAGYNFDDEDYSSGDITILSNSELNIFIVELNMDCEGQCEREGSSQFIFFDFEEMMNFLKTDKDCCSCLQKSWNKDGYEEKIRKIHNLCIK